jgi:hypothetical protein
MSKPGKPKSTFNHPQLIAEWLRGGGYPVEQVGRIVTAAENNGKWQDDDILVTWKRGVFTVVVKSLCDGC